MFSDTGNEKPPLPEGNVEGSSYPPEGGMAHYPSAPQGGMAPYPAGTPVQPQGLAGYGPQGKWKL